MKIFDGVQNFFESLTKSLDNNTSTLFWIFLGAFLAVSVIVIFITSFSYECKLTKTIDRINKFFERNPRINDDNLVAFNNMMKASSVPKTLRRQWQQFMLYREHPASYYMSFKHCVENPLRNSTYHQQMTIYKVISFILIALSFVISAFMSRHIQYADWVIQDMIIIPLTILVLYWAISMVLDLIHSAISSDLFQNYQYFEINIDKAMLTLPEFVDYEVLFSQDEIKRGIPVLFAYLQKRAIQEQQELEKARLKSVDHEKFDFDKAGLDGSLVLDRAMRETENYTSQRKKYMQEIERVNNEIAALENNYKEHTKEFQRQVQTSKETVENLKEQLEQANSTIEINYIKKQMRDEINRQQLAEKEFDILTDKNNQEIKGLNQEIKHYEEEIKKAKEAMEVAMLSEFNTYSVKVYDNLEKIVDEKMQDKVDGYKDQIKGLEGELEEKNEELENVYTRYQEVLAQTPVMDENQEEEFVDDYSNKKSRKKKKSDADGDPTDDGFVQPEQLDEYIQPEYEDGYSQYDDNQSYEQYDDTQGYDAQEYAGVSDFESENNQDYQQEEYYDEYNDYIPAEDGQDNYVPVEDENGEYVPTDNFNQEEYVEDYVPTEQYDEYVPTGEEYVDTSIDEDAVTDNAYVPLDDYNSDNQEYVPLQEDEYTPTEEYVPFDDYSQQGFVNGEYVPLDSGNDNETYVPMEENDNNQSGEVEENSTEENLDDTQDDSTKFDDTDFDIDFADNSDKTSNFDDLDFDFDFGDKKTDITTESKEELKDENQDVELEEDDEDFDLNKILGIYDDSDKSNDQPSTEDDDILGADFETEDNSDEDLDNEELAAPVVKRRVGRPRKVVDETEVKEKRRVGRPRKVVEDEIVMPKRKPGRPRKVVDETEVEEKRRVGRPKKVTTTENVVTRRPGRPRKNENLEANIALPENKKRGRGRPRKSGVEVNTVKTPSTKTQKRRGRPRKDDAVTLSKHVGRGRPRKNSTVKGVAQKTTGKRGRPRKQAVVTNDEILGKPKRRPGRPRKNG